MDFFYFVQCKKEFIGTLLNDLGGSPPRSRCVSSHNSPPHKRGDEGDNLGGHLLARITGHVQLRKEEKYKETLLT